VCLLLDVRVRRRSLASSEPCLPLNSVLCCPLSLWKTKSVYHSDWRSITFFSLAPTNTHRHTRCPTRPPPPTITSFHYSDTHTHSSLHLQPAGTDNITQWSSIGISLPFAGLRMLYDCHASRVECATLLAPGRRRAKLSRLCGEYMLLQLGHYREITALCRTAWECSVLLGKSRSGSDEALMGWQ